jgi:ParB family transcriptional regulator, chromosome partitioning protein
MTDAKQKLDFNLYGLSPGMPRIIEIELTKLRPNPDQPRTRFNEETIKELAASIEQHGLIQPISVVPDPESENQEGFIIVAGERRYRAHQHLEKPTITAIITKGNSDEIALIENIQREDLSAMDQAEGLASMMQRHGYKQEELAKVVGKSRPTVTELLSLNSLPQEIKEECRTFDIPKSLLVQIVRVSKPEEQLRFWGEYKKGEVKTVREAKKRKAGDSVTRTEPQPKKAKRTFETTQKATVIVQGQTLRLTRAQTIAALQEALDQAGGKGEKQSGKPTQ